MATRYRAGTWRTSPPLVGPEELTDEQHEDGSRAPQSMTVLMIMVVILTQGFSMYGMPNCW